jgi:hypothetical protein
LVITPPVPTFRSAPLSPSASHLRRTDFTPAADSFRRDRSTKSRRSYIGGKNDQVNHCCFCLDLGNIRASYVARAASSAGRHDHANP